jgi:hypothetical protein
MVKKSTVLFAIVLFFAAIFAPVSAQTTATRGAVRQEATIERLRTRADAEITRRVNALTALFVKIGAMKRLTSDQKTTFTTGIQSQITSLNTLKTKIESDNDITLLRADVQSIVKGYRIFALYLPQVTIMAHADRILVLVDQMNAVSVKLKTRSDAVSAGTDTSAVKAVMANFSSKLTDATTQANNAISAVVSLTPDGFPGNKTALQSARGMLQTARQDLTAAEKDMTQIRQALHTTTPTP